MMSLFLRLTLTLVSVSLVFAQKGGKGGGGEGSDESSGSCAEYRNYFCSDASSQEAVFICLEEHFFELSDECQAQLDINSNSGARCMEDITRQCHATENVLEILICMEDMELLDISDDCLDKFDEMEVSACAYDMEMSCSQLVSGYECVEDRETFCSDYSDPYEVMTCMLENFDSFSSDCQAAMESEGDVPGSGQSSGQPSGEGNSQSSDQGNGDGNGNGSCTDDKATFCGSYSAPPEIKECMEANYDSLSSECQAAMDNDGGMSGGGMSGGGMSGQGSGDNEVTGFDDLVQCMAILMESSVSDECGTYLSGFESAEAAANAAVEDIDVLTDFLSDQGDEGGAEDEGFKVWISFVALGVLVTIALACYCMHGKSSAAKSSQAAPKTDSQGRVRLGSLSNMETFDDADEDAVQHDGTTVHVLD